EQPLDKGTVDMSDNPHKDHYYIDGKIYDFSDWQKIHPGGDVFFRCSFQRDISALVHAYHRNPDALKPILEKYEVELEGVQPRDVLAKGMNAPRLRRGAVQARASKDSEEGQAARTAREAAGAPRPRVAHSAVVALLAAAAGGLGGAELLGFEAPLLGGCPDCPEVPACPALPQLPRAGGERARLPGAGPWPGAGPPKASPPAMSLLMFEGGGAWWSDLKPSQTIGIQYRGDDVDHERLRLHPCTKDRDVWYIATPDLDEYPEAGTIGPDADIIKAYPLPDDGSKPAWLKRNLYRFRVYPDRDELAAMIWRGYQAAVAYDPTAETAPPALKDALLPTGEEVAIEELIPSWPEPARRRRGKQSATAGVGSAGPRLPPPADAPSSRRMDAEQPPPGLRWHAMGYGDTLSPGDEAALQGQTFVAAGDGDALVLDGSNYAHCRLAPSGGPPRGSLGLETDDAAAKKDDDPAADSRTFGVDYDNQGGRFKAWRDVTRESTQETFADTPLEGPGATLFLCKHFDRHGGDPQQRLLLWLRGRKIDGSDRTCHEMKVLCDVLYFAGLHDHVNVGAFASLETLSRRLCMGCMGTGTPDNPVSPALQSFAARRAMDRADVIAALGQGGSRGSAAARRPGPRAPRPATPLPAAEGEEDVEDAAAEGATAAAAASAGSHPPPPSWRPGSANLAAFNADLVSLPDGVAGPPPIESLLGAEVSRHLGAHHALMLRPLTELENIEYEAREITLYTDRKLHYNKTAYHGFVKSLWDLGMLGATLQPREKAFASIEIGDGDASSSAGPRLHLGMAGAKDSFHRLKAPAWLRPFFARPEAPARAVGLSELGGAGLRPTDVAWSTSAPMCTGFARSLSFAQKADGRLASVAPRLRGSELLHGRSPPPALSEGRPRHCVCVDNLGAVSTDLGVAERAAREGGADFAAHGLELHGGEVLSRGIRALG
ncbi:unnamed protein product, partial [Prorocentrum cordatum]